LEFEAGVPQATANEELDHGPYVEARAGFEHMTLRTKDDESTNESPCPQYTVITAIKPHSTITQIYLGQLMHIDLPLKHYCAKYSNTTKWPFIYLF